MEIAPTTIIWVGVVCVLLGYLASVLINTLTDEGDAPAETTEEAPPGGRKGRYTPVFRVWREKGAGTLIVEIDGKAMVAPDPLNEVQRERLERTVRDLRVWLGMGLAATPAGQLDDALQSNAAEDEVPEINLSRAFISAPASPDIPEKRPAQGQQGVRPEVKPTSSSYPAAYQPPIAQRGAAAQPPAPKGKEKVKDELIAPAAKSIVLQIEDILQDIIAGTELAHRGVHLMEDPIRGVIVQIGLEHFEGIDAVPDAQIKAIIQSAVKEWEQSQG